RLINNVARQEIRSVSNPLAMLPNPPPARLTAVQTAMARVRSGPSAWVVVNKVNVAGDAAAAETPCAARAAMSTQPSVATPPMRLAMLTPATLQASSPAVPTTSSNHAPTSSNPPNPKLKTNATHDAATPETPRSAWIEENATFTTETSSTTIS